MTPEQAAKIAPLLCLKSWEGTILRATATTSGGLRAEAWHQTAAAWQPTAAFDKIMSCPDATVSELDAVGLSPAMVAPSAWPTAMISTRAATMARLLRVVSWDGEMLRAVPISVDGLFGIDAQRWDVASHAWLDCDRIDKIMSCPEATAAELRDAGLSPELIAPLQWPR